MKRLIPFIFFLVVVVFADGQSPKLQWVKQIGSTFDDLGLVIEVDMSGNSYAFGTFKGLVDFDPGPGVHNLNALNGGSVIVKLNRLGNFVWAKNFGWEGSGMSMDSSGNIYTIGTFNGVIDFDPGPGMFELRSDTFSSMFILKLDKDGNFVWVKQVRTGRYPFMIDVKAVKTDRWGNIYATGGFSGNIDFDPGFGVFSLTTAEWGRNIFVLKLRTSGDFVWVKQMGDTLSASQSLFMTIDGQGGIYTSGFFRGDADFDPDTAKSYILKVVPSPIVPIVLFMSKLDSNGHFVWAKSIDQLDYRNSITADKMGNFIISGTFSGTVDFDPSVGVFNVTRKNTSIFILKLDPMGNFIWVKSLESSSMGFHTSAVTVDLAGNIYTTGYFSGTVDFDPDTGIFSLTADALLNAEFILKIDAQGNFIWAKTIHGEVNDVLAFSIVVDHLENIYTTGIFSRTVDFDPDDEQFNLTSKGDNDIFIHKMGKFPSVFSIYPNPTRGVFKVDILNIGIKVEIMIYNALGSLIHKQTSLNESNSIDLSEQPDGIYFVKVVYEGGFVMEGKVVKD